MLFQHKTTGEYFKGTVQLVPKHVVNWQTYWYIKLTQIKGRKTDFLPFTKVKKYYYVKS